MLALMRGTATARWLVIVVAVVLLTLIAGGVVAGYRAVVRDKWLKPARTHEHQTADAVEAFCGAQEVLAKEPFFLRPTRQNPRDASPVLSASIGWRDSSIDGGVPVPKGSFVIPGDISSRTDSFMDDLTAEDLKAADTGFLATLHDYDRWDLLGGTGPLTAAASWNGATAPMPQFLALLTAARVHLKRGAAEGTLAAAGRDVRHIAYLAWTTETLLGGLVGIALLDIEHQAWSWADQRAIDTQGWFPVPKATIDRAQKVLRAAPAFYSPMANEKTFARAVACDRVTRCSALTETALFASSLARLVDEPWRSRALTVSTATDAPRDGCTFALARYWASRQVFEVPEGIDGFMLKGDVGGILMTIATPFSDAVSELLPDGGQ